ncbi:MAG: OB-fold domain-containing protein [Deltaproteobacteria bacterium]
MPSITSYAGYLPAYRMPRQVMARQWGGHAMPGERTVANFDEDSLTMAVAASLDALGGGQAPDAVMFASTTSPYRQKSVAATLATVVGAGAGVRTLDLATTLRASSGAVMTAFDLVGSGSNQRILVAAGEVRAASPDSFDEQSAGDAGAAVVISSDGDGLVPLARASVSEEFHGTWRRDSADYVQGFPGSLDAKLGYARVMPEVIGQVLKEAGAEAKDIGRAVICGPNPKLPMGLAAGLGFDVTGQLEDTLWMVAGDTGAAQPLLLLAAALEKAEPGSLLLWAVYGDGADAMLFRVGEAVAAAKPTMSVASQVEMKRPLENYGKYERFRGLVKRDYINMENSSASILYRDRREILELCGGKCPECGTLQFPLDRVCVSCGYSGGLEETLLPRKGKVFTFYENHVFPHPDPPMIEAVVELDGGARFFGQMTDIGSGEVSIGMPVEMVFRLHHGEAGIHNYFWKARPARNGMGVADG